MVASEHVDLDFDAADALRVVVVQVAARRLIGRPIGLHAGLHAKVEATAPSVEREVAVSTEVDPAKPRGGRELREACTRAELLAERLQAVHELTARVEDGHTVELSRH